MSARAKKAREVDHSCECELVEGHPGKCWCGGCSQEFPARLHGNRVYLGSHDAGLASWDPVLKAFVARRGPGRPPLDPAGSDPRNRVAIVLTQAQRAKAESIAHREGLQGVAAGVRWCVDRAP